MPPPKSAVWSYFKRLLNGNTVKCTLCDTELKYCGGTTNMINHIRLKHPAEGPAESPVKQSSIQSFINSPRKLNSDTKEKITLAIAEMVVKDYLPLSFVEGDESIRFQLKKRLISEISSAKSASLTTDTWTSTATESYITVTEHHITDNWELKANVLCTRAMPERHTGDNIANKLQSIVSEFELDGKIDTCVHDNARNMECAGNKCLEWGDFGCFGHTLQLCIKPVFELASVAKLIQKCRKLVGHFKHSTTVTAEMRNRQKLLGVPEHELVQDVVTRWNSTQAMLSRLVEQRRTLTDILLDEKVTKKQIPLYFFLKTMSGN
ncbi:unnamed protein product [Mytilus edulis]|uniref:BED-type domain-containing protein n=1 Tax=Mytilus edulis TaxID=6550 RepID=A0A8S3R0M8_MYTED|nr:unnamed protein product [Mytilus edulis]